MLVGSFAVSAVLVAVVRAYCIKVGFVSVPHTDRFAEKTVSLGGGIAIFITLALSILTAITVVKLLALLGSIDWLGESVTIHIPGFLDKFGQLLIVLCVSTALFGLGLWDDLKHLDPFFKLIVQFVLAIVAAAFADIRIEFFIENRIITSLLSAVWIVLLINVFNFLDNMDGAAAGIAVIVTGYLFTAAALSGQVFVGGLALVFIGTLLGFLVFNFPPARIFSGDAGSLVIGFFVALFSIRTTYYNEAQSGPWYPVVMPFIVMAVPLYDFVSVTLLRISQGKSPFVGDTQHFSHRLKKRGLTDTQTVLTLYLTTLCTGLGATFLYQVNIIGAMLIFTQTVLILAIIAILESTGRNDKSEN